MSQSSHSRDTRVILLDRNRRKTAVVAKQAIAMAEGTSGAPAYSYRFCGRGVSILAITEAKSIKDFRDIVP
jgi:hypothetical protein